MADMKDLNKAAEGIAETAEELVQDADFEVVSDEEAKAAYSDPAPQAEPAGAADETPTLTLDDDLDVKVPLMNMDVAANVSRDEMFARERFTEAEQKQIDNFSKQIDLKNMDQIMKYGAGAQKKTAMFSEQALQGVRTKDFGEMGKMLAELTTEIRGFGKEDKKGLRGLFQKGQNKIDALKVQYATSEQNINKVSKALESHQFTLLKDIALMDKLYDQNKLYFKELSMYIAAGRQKLDEVRNNELVELQMKAQQSGLEEDAQEARDLASMCDRFEKKLHDLDLTRAITLQSAPQIRLVQEDDAIMAEKIQSTLNNAIPLWKNQMVLALGVAHAEEAAKAQQMVTDTINEVMKKNADTLKQATISVAEQNERAIVDIETLEHTNQQLISTIDEVIEIQEAGRERRKNAEIELTRIEEELKTKLLAASGKQIEQQQ